MLCSSNSCQYYGYGPVASNTLYSSEQISNLEIYCLHLQMTNSSILNTEGAGPSETSVAHLLTKRCQIPEFRNF